MDSASFTFILYPFLLTAFSGALLSAVYLISQALYQKIKNLLFASIEIESMDPIYSWLLDYLTELGYLKGSVNKLTCKILRKESSPYFWVTSSDLNTDKERPNLIFQPNNGDFFSLINRLIFFKEFIHFGMKGSEYI